jgi:hypothetical protein
VSYYLTVKRLRDMLKRYDDDAIVMVGENREGGGAVDADDEPTYSYRTPDGEIVDQFDASYGDTLTDKDRVVILWGVDK